MQYVLYKNHPVCQEISAEDMDFCENSIQNFSIENSVFYIN